MYSTGQNTLKRSMDFSTRSSIIDQKKKKRSRWGGNEVMDKTIIPGMPTVIPANLSADQQQQYILHLQIEEISRKLRTGELGIPPNPEDRSPSPEPIYNNEGKRLNTREYRTRKKLEDERHKLIQEAMNANSEYKPPADYKPPIQRVNDKVMIPQDLHPEINFVGLLIGPRGNTLKNLEKETGAKIIIRGKGSVKEGKIGRKDGQPLPGEDEPLHAYVTAGNPENVLKAVEKIKEIITQGIEVPEGQNDLRRQQLRELALLNGTLRENDGLAKLKQLQQAQTIVTNTIICTVCGGTGHIAQDCKERRPGDNYRMQQIQTPTDKAKMDSEYMSLMAELGEGPEPQQKPDNMQPHFHPPPHHPPPQNQQHPPQQFQQRPNFTHPPPNPMAVNPPWQQGGNIRPPPNAGSQHHNFQGQPPPGNVAQPPIVSQHMPGHQAPQHLPSNSFSPLPPSQAQGGIPSAQGMANPVSPPTAPWVHQQFVPASQGQTPNSSAPNTTSGPPPALAPPPPPPVSQTGSTLPWHQQQQQQPTQTSYTPVPVPPPPPATTVTTSGVPPWQNNNPNVAPMHSNNIPPWQVSSAQQQQQQQQQSPVPQNHMPPPPPPPSQRRGFSPMAPPPPPPAGFDNNPNMSGGPSMMMSPPPPPPS